MSFLYPQFFWAFIALAIPIIIHFLNLHSYITVYFSNLSFLTDINKETKSKIALKKLLLLIVRLLILSSLVLAFAYPVKKSISVQKKFDKQNIIICIDNSLSMSANKDIVRLIDRAKTKAKNIVNSYSKNTNFYLISQNKSLQKYKLTQSQIIEEIEKLDLWPKSSNLEYMVDRAGFLQQKNDKNNFVCYLISDFQKSNTNFGSFNTKTFQKLYLVNILPDNYKNISIDSVWTESPNHIYMQNEKLFVKLDNHGNEIIQNLQVNLWINDSLRNYSVVSVNPNASKIIHFNYSNTDMAQVLGKIEINDFSLSFDNQFYFSYFIRKKTNIELVNPEKEKWLTHFYSDTSFYTLKSLNNVKEIGEENLDLLVLNKVKTFDFGEQEKLLELIKQGTNVLFIPSMEGSSGIYNSFLREIASTTSSGIDTNEQYIDFIDYEHPIFKTAIKKQNKYYSLPKVEKYFIINNLYPNEKSVLEFLNHNIALKEVQYGEGKVFIFSFPLSKSNSNFTENPILIPILFNIAYLKSSKEALYSIIDDNLTLNLPISYKESYAELPLRIKKYKTEDYIIPGIFQTYNNKLNLKLYDQISETGNYLLIEKSPIYTFSFNQNKSESKNDYYSLNEIKNEIDINTLENTETKIVKDDKLNSGVNVSNTNNSYWYIFILLAFVLIIGETLIQRFWI